MTQEFFNRHASFQLGYSGKIGVIISGLRIAFEIQKTETAEANQAVISINNLSKSTRDQVVANTGMIGILSAGYLELGRDEIIFAGDVINVTHNLTKPDVVTQVTLADGSIAIRSKTISVSYKAGTPVSKIALDAINGLALPRKSLPGGVNIQGVLRKGYAFNGLASTLLSRLGGDNGFSWSVQNGDIKIYPMGVSDGSAPLKSVIIGSPRKIFKAAQDFNGYEFDCLLLPKAAPGCSVNITSKELPNGVNLQIAEVKHSGDTHGDKWTTTIMGRLNAAR